MAFFASTLLGVQPIPVEIEIDLSGGLPFFQIVGLPDAVLKESKTRVKSAIIQAGFEFPYDSRIVMNLAPSKVRKEGSGFELGLAARVLASSHQIPQPDFSVMFLGELALDGSVRPIPEIEALIYSCHSLGDCKALVVPAESVASVRTAVNYPVIGIRHLKDLARPLWWQPRDEGTFPPDDGSYPLGQAEREASKLWFSPFWARHLLIAALGEHHYLLCGPPGSGKSYFADSLRLFSQFRREPDNTELQILDSLFKRPAGELPWAAPHHSVSTAGLLGGGGVPRPGAVTRAHGGILFLDELLEFSGSVLDSLREPVEKGSVEIYRAGQGVVFPSRVQLVAATNPCRCGNWRNMLKPCHCSKPQRQIYQRRMSGPFFDRFDVRIFCPPPLGREPLISGRTIVQKIKEARAFRVQSGPALWSSPVTAHLEKELSRKLGNRRRVEKVRVLAETLAGLDCTNQVRLQDLQEAERYQYLPELEGRC